jgi:predicted phosphodiesterase
MRIAVLADIHANFEALQAVSADIATWKPDLVAVIGDIVNRGPRPKECLDFVFEKQQTEGWICLRENHEDYVISRSRPEAALPGAPFEVHRASYWTYLQLNRDVRPLQALPLKHQIALPGLSDAHFTHASIRGLRDGIYPETTEETLRQQIAHPASLFCVGHTHRPLIRWLDGTLVVNTGSAGLPFDGDSRASYARLTFRDSCWYAEITRIAYDVSAAERDFFETGYFEEAGPLIALVLIELQQARSQLYQWAVEYQEPALAGLISMHEAVSQYLGQNK